MLHQISQTYKESQKRGRLWIEDQVISGAKLEETLEDYGISIGQVVYVEFSNANNQWPSDKVTDMEKTRTPSSKVEKSDELRTAGLYNLGNSKKINIILIIIACYMNSALQCIANTKFFYEYFVKE